MGMATPLYTLEQLQTLSAACAAGVLTVRYEGPPAREVTYQSLDAMRRQLAAMRRELDPQAPFRLAGSRKGLSAGIPGGPGRFGDVFGDPTGDEP